MSTSLESAAMLTALWSKNQSDIIDLLTPFVKYSISKSTKVNSQLSISRVLEILENEIAYEKLPVHVVLKLIRRLKSQGIIEETGKKNFILKVSLEADASAFEDEKRTQKFIQNEVGRKLADYLNEVLFRNSYDEQMAIEVLIDFFEIQGLTIGRQPNNLELFKKKGNGVHYHIGQFIFQEYRAQSLCFDYITDILKGYFISTAIFFHVNNLQSIEKVKFENTTVYLDTSLILNVLGLQTGYQAEATIELIDMLKKQGAGIACFRQTVDEVRGIIHAYRRDLINGRTQFRQGGPTLEGWDEQGVTPAEIDVFDLALESKIRSLGIKIAEKPPMGDIHEYPIDEAGLQSRLATNISYPKHRNDSLLHDVGCISSICLLRNGSTPSEIEKCGHLFVTSNTALVKEASSFILGGQKRTVSPLISEPELAAVLWLKNFSNFGDYPKSKLIEHAVLAMEPNDEIIEKFYSYIDQIEQNGDVSDEKIAAIRAGLLSQREIMELANGDADSINTNTAYEAIELLKRKYDNDHMIELSAEQKRANQESEKNIAAQQNAIAIIERAKETAYTARYRSLKCGVVIVLFAIGALLVIAAINLFFNTSNTAWIWCPIALLLFDIASIILLLCDKFATLNRWLKYLARQHSDKIADEKRAEYLNIFPQLLEENTLVND